jgi:hypothetical protein
MCRLHFAFSEMKPMREKEQLLLLLHLADEHENYCSDGTFGQERGRRGKKME